MQDPLLRQLQLETNGNDLNVRAGDFGSSHPRNHVVGGNPDFQQAAIQGSGRRSVQRLPGAPFARHFLFKQVAADGSQSGRSLCHQQLQHPVHSGFLLNLAGSYFSY